MESALDVGRLSDTLSRLNERAAAMERGLAEIRELQKQMASLIEQAERLGRYGLAVEGLPITVPSEPQEVPPTVGEAATFTDAVITVFEQRTDAILGVDDVLEILKESRSDATKERVRNAIYYADKLGKLHRVEGRPGKFTLKDTSTPVAAGVEVGEKPDTEGFSGEIGGGRDEPSAPPHDQGGGARDARIHLDRVGDRAPIG
jgi:hypothetical protein